MTQASYQSQF